MVAASPVTSKSKAEPTPIEAAKPKVKEAPPIVFNIPPDKVFAAEDMEYLAAMDLVYIAKQVITETAPDLQDVKIEDVDFAWKCKGGKEDGHNRLFGVKLQDDVAKFHGARPWLVWFAADHCKAIKDSPTATRASMYAALKRIGYDQSALTGETVPRIQKPELVMFLGGYQRFGAWRREITLAENVFQQSRIPGI